jgi:ribosomal protein L11 methyltransferase
LPSSAARCAARPRDLPERRDAPDRRLRRVIRLALRVRRADAEVVLAELLQLAPAGVEELEVGEDHVEYAVYGAPGELPELPDLQAAAGEAFVEVSTTELADDWGERWKRFHQPILIEAPGRSPPGRAASPAVAAPAEMPSLRVRPPWEPALDLTGTKEIVIDPNQAFGTGAHHTTRLCLELLLELAASDGRRGAVIDVGTGSGVLAIAAAQLGFAPVLGLDHEQESVLATRENAHVNGVAVEARRFDLRRESLPAGDDGGSDDSGSMPVVLANLVRALLLDLAVSLTSVENVPRELIASGLLRAETDEVVAAFEAQVGLRERERRYGGEWAAVWLTAED